MTGVGQEVEETKEARPRDWSAVLSALFVVREYVKLYAALSAVFLLSTIAIYALVPPTYTAEATIGPPGPSPTDAMLIQQIGGAGIAANLLGGAGVTSRSDPYQEFIQLLQDSRLARVLIEKDHLLPTIFYRAWDSDAKGWKPRWPTHYVTDAAKTILQRPIYPEPEMDQLTDYLSDHLTVSKIDSGARSLIETDGFQRIAIVCVGTPSALTGAHDMSQLVAVSGQIASAVDKSRSDPLTVVYRSTVRPGTVENLIQPVFAEGLKDRIGAIELVYNPEFLREATAIKDFFAPPKIVLGTFDGKPSKNMELLNAKIDAPVFYTRYREAEIIKLVDNTFHALKVTFANEVGRVCMELGINTAKVHEIFVSDTKLNVSPYYFRPGGAFGGSCLPKDVRAFQYIAKEVAAATHVIDNLIRSNEAHKNYLFNYVTAGVKKGARVLLVGVAFKPESDDLRESPSLELARALVDAGFELSIYDEFVDATNLTGQNRDFAISRLPSLADLLVSKRDAQTSTYDLVIDTCGQAQQLELRGSVVPVRIDMLP